MINFYGVQCNVRIPKEKCYIPCANFDLRCKNCSQEEGVLWKECGPEIRQGERTQNDDKNHKRGVVPSDLLDWYPVSRCVEWHGSIKLVRGCKTGWQGFFTS